MDVFVLYFNLFGRNYWSIRHMLLSMVLGDQDRKYEICDVEFSYTFRDC